MSATKGIFDNFPTPGEPGQPSPFAPAEAPTSSPFMAVDDLGTKSTKIPDRRSAPDSPFQFAGDSDSGFGFEPVPQAQQPSPFEPVPATSASPFAPANPAVAASPFAPAPSDSPFAPASSAPANPPQYEPQPPPFNAVAPAAPANPPQSEPHASPFTAVAPAAPANPPQSEPQASPFTAVAPAAPVAPAAVASPPPAESPPAHGESSAIRQLELRAIFSVDHEMSPDEILQRCRNLPGIRHVARIVDGDAAALDSFRAMLERIGFGSGSIRLYSGSVPIEFIREGHVVLAVQTDGGFAPGIRETLMIVSRELAKM